jgi:acyl-CoA synthetase (AMP-forming)/AMP-acid ligase II
MLAALPAELWPNTSSLQFKYAALHPRRRASPGSMPGTTSRSPSGYGTSEATCSSIINPVAGPRRARTVGVAFPGQETRIVDGSGRQLAAGDDVEVVVRGPNVTRGYLGRPEETAEVIVDGWLHTGDLGHRDTDGYLTLVGRSKDTIMRGGRTSIPRRSRTSWRGTRRPRGRGDRRTRRQVGRAGRRLRAAAARGRPSTKHHSGGRWTRILKAASSAVAA